MAPALIRVVPVAHVMVIFPLPSLSPPNASLSPYTLIAAIAAAVLWGIFYANIGFGWLEGSFTTNHFRDGQIARAAKC